MDLYVQVFPQIFEVLIYYFFNSLTLPSVSGIPFILTFFRIYGWISVDHVGFLWSFLFFSLSDLSSPLCDFKIFLQVSHSIFIFSALLNILCTACYLVLEFLFDSFENFSLSNKELFYSHILFMILLNCLEFSCNLLINIYFQFCQIVCNILCLWVWPLEIDNFSVMPCFLDISYVF